VLNCRWVKATHCGGCCYWILWCSFLVWLWVDHDRFGGMERAWLSSVEGVVCIASTWLTCCDVVLALWIEHGGGMRAVRVEGGVDHEDQVQYWRLEEIGGKGQRSSRVAQHSRPGCARETPRLLRGKVRYFPRAMWWHRGKDSNGDGRGPCGRERRSERKRSRSEIWR
jgi:hypothetical protein